MAAEDQAMLFFKTPVAGVGVKSQLIKYLPCKSKEEPEFDL